MGSQPNLACRSDVVSICKCPPKFGGLLKNLGSKNIAFSATFLQLLHSTLHISGKKRRVDKPKNCANLQYVAYKLTYFLPLTQERLKFIGSLRPIHENFAFSQILSKKFCYKVFLCENFQQQMVHRWIVGDVHIYLKFAIQVTHPMKIIAFSVIAGLTTQRPINKGQPNFAIC